MNVITARYPDGLSEEKLNSFALVELLRLRAHEQPDKLAYSFLPDGDQAEVHLTYGQLDTQARAVAASLQVMGAAGGRALLLYPPGIEFVVAFFGCLYAGVVAVPAYPARNARGVPRLRAIVKDAEAGVVLTTSSILATVHNAFAQAAGVEALKWLATDAIESYVAGVWKEHAAKNNDLAFLQYTSGSTGKPKGVMLTHGNLLHNANLVYNAVEHTPEDKYVSWLPTFHDMGFMAGVLEPLYAGIPVVLMSPVSFLQRPIQWLQAISEHKGTTSGGPNFAYDLCVRKTTEEQRAALDLSSWTVAFNGAEPIRAHTLDRFVRAFAPCGFRAETFFPCYGLAEATLIVTGSGKSAPPIVNTIESGQPRSNTAAELAAGAFVKAMVGCGSTLGEQKITIVNPETCAKCEPGEIGEIWVSGPSIAQGYWNNPQETESTFYARINGSAEGPYLRTGDLGSMQGEELFVVGRLKDLIIIRGRNHYPQDIELTVERCNASFRPGCNAAFSIDVEGEERLVVVQEIDARQQIDTASAVEAIRGKIAEEHEIQVHAVALIKPGTIPKTSSGKIQRRATKAAFLKGGLEVIAEWQGNEASQTAADEFAFAGTPETREDMERWLASQIAARVGLNQADIDVTRATSCYGVDSLADVELVHSIEAAFGVSLPVSSFLQDASVSELADRVLAQRKDSSASDRSIIRRGQQPAEFPLSYGQQALWFLHQLAPHSSAYNVVGAVLIHSELDVEALRRAFHILIERHAPLRTSFKAGSGAPVQIIRANVEACFDHQNASEWDEETLRGRLEQEAGKPFDLENGPVFRVSLFSRSDSEHVLVLAAHHIVVDLWSLAVLLKEASVLYESERSQTAPNLSALEVTYADYVLWQSQSLAGPRGDELWAFWKEELSGDLPILSLAERPRPAVQTYTGASHSFMIGRELTDELRALGRENGATLYTTLLAAYYALLYRHTGQEDLLIGSPTTGRSRAEFEGLVGYFVNPVVVRADLSGDQTFRQFLAQVRHKVLRAFEHQDYPLPLLVDRLQPERDSSHSPLFQTMFSLQKAPLFTDQSLAALALGEEGARMEFGSLSLESMKLDQRIAQFDITLLMAETESGLTACFQYNTDLFEPATIDRLSAHFKNLLRGIVSDASLRVSELPLLTQSESARLLVEWNETNVEYGGAPCLHELIEDQVKRTPDAVAVEFRGERLNYRELNDRANQIARHLRSLGVGPEVTVGVCMERSIELVTSLLGVLKSGGAYLPLDPAYPRQRLETIIEDAGLDVILTHTPAAEALPRECRAIVVDREWETISKNSTRNVAGGAHSSNLAYVIYTSGSTGKPKGAMNTHAGICNRLMWMQEEYGLGAEDAVLQKTPFSFDVSVWEFFWPLMAGARLVVAEPGGHQDSSYLAREIRQKQITTIHFVPSMLQVFLQEPGIEECESLARVICSGEALTWEMKEKFFDRLGCQLHNLYGPTEAAVDVTFWECRRRSADRKVPIGRPIANITTYILDKHLNVVPVGVKGELHLGGVGVGRGYLGRPDLTAESFIANPYGKAGERLYKTGDVARYLEDGTIEYLGRLDHQVKIRGFRIELGEIAAATGEHNSVEDAVIVVREDLPGDNRIVGYVVTKQGAEVTGKELREYLKERLPEYMVPSAFVMLERMPLNANGKVDRKALPPPDLSSFDETASILPRTPTEQIIAGIFEGVLGLKRVGALESFFDLGGNSLLATQAVSRIRSAFEIELPLRRIFESPSVGGLALAIEATRGSRNSRAATPIQRAPEDSEIPLSFAQQRLWFIDQLDPESYAYNMPGAMWLNGPLDVAVLEQSLNQILARHEDLRTTFPIVDSHPVQLVSQELKLDLPVIDISHLDERERAAWVHDEGFKEARKPFNLATGPLIRAKLTRLTAQQHVLFLTMHHIISDGWSFDVFLNELATLYEAGCSGQPSTLPELSIQYADFAVWQRQRLRGEVREELISYWKEKLGGELPVLQLPTDRPRSANPSVEGARQSITLSTDLSAALKALSRREGATLFMTMTAAFKMLLHWYSGQEEIVLGTPIANRNRAETEGLVGFFVNTLILRDDLSGNPTFRELLGRIRKTALDAYAHQDLPFEQLVEELQPERETSRNPLFQAMIVAQNAPLPERTVSGLTMTPVEVGGVTTKFIDLVLDFLDTDQGLVSSFEYSTDLFDESTIARALANFNALLERIVANPDALTSELLVLTDVDRRQLLVEWNDTDVDYPFELCMHQLLEANAEKFPEGLAVVSEEGTVTYKELNERANRVGHYLRSLGVGPEVLVGICAERSIELIVGMLGILKAGGAYVPLDPEYPKDRLASMLEDAQVPILLTQERLLDRLPEHSSRVVCIEADWEVISSHSAENVDSGVTADNLAFVLYTSGSTGKPKGVMIFHRAACNHIFWIQHRHPMDETDRMPLKYSICFDASVFEIFYTLHAGARLIIARQGMQQDLVYLVSLIEQHKITVLDLVGAQLQVLMDDERFLKCNWLKRVSCGNDSMLGEVKERYFREMGKELIHFYGPCETSIGSTCHVCVPGGDHQVVSIGKPVSNTQVYVVDPQLQPVPFGVVGEIVIGGIGVTRGYLRRPDVTAEKFIPNPFSDVPGERLYKTGDLARFRSDGTLEFAGRIDHQVKIRGFRIELGDIESALKQHASVREVLVLARSNDEFGGALALSGGPISARALADLLSSLGAEAADELLSEVEIVTDADADLLVTAESRSRRPASESGLEMTLGIQDGQSAKASHETQVN